VFEDVVVYAADPWHTPALASINRFYLQEVEPIDDDDDDDDLDPATVCTFAAGDGTGGTETRIDSAPSAQACAILVRETQPSANGATYSNTGGTDCYAEFGMTGRNDSASWQTCSW
jgi:hypothetical protein